MLEVEREAEEMELLEQYPCQAQEQSIIRKASFCNDHEHRFVLGYNWEQGGAKLGARMMLTSNYDNCDKYRVL